MIIGVSSDEQEPRKFANAIQQLSAGRSNAVIEVTLTPNAASTVVNFDSCSVDTAPIPVPMTAQAGAELGAGTLYISAVANKSFTIAHANNSNSNRKFRFVCIG